MPVPELRTLTDIGTRCCERGPYGGNDAGRAPHGSLSTKLRSACLGRQSACSKRLLQLRQNDEEIADQAVVGNLEDR
ncbi:hypothetical protein P9272_34185, partial [Mesorhizobium sp. WSM4976]|uniref:hypothetical protein n=1 Tax=Mesorhizobium sp. WSM4976 TaxID=3038549 RepID=UPI0024180F80